MAIGTVARKTRSVETQGNPMLKCAGGKRQIMKGLISNVPDRFGVYYEPFVGGGALMTSLYNLGLLIRGVVSDINQDLVGLCRIVKRKTAELAEKVLSLKFRNSRSDYCMARNGYNSMDGKFDVGKGSLFLYLNGHCYNGLYRVNSSGEFNVPFGKYKNPGLPTASDIMLFSQALKNIEIKGTDFGDAVKNSSEGDFVYDPLSRKPTSFSCGRMSGSIIHQILKKLNRRGSSGFSMICRKEKLGLWRATQTQILSKKYIFFNIIKISARRAINSKAGGGRSSITELLIKNYPNNPC